jgi:sulfur-oxidizing protein SoxY
MKKKVLSVLFAAALAVSVGGMPASAGSDRPESTWLSIQGDIFEKTEFLPGDHLLSMEAPYRAEDAALVPIAITAKPDADIRKITIVIDENPAPMAAAFTFGPGAASASFSSRFRVNSYSWVRAIAETGDGKLYMVKKFVKASGGCSAPANKDAEAALANLGKMKMRLFEAKQTVVLQQSKAVREAQIMIRHPNYSGLQMDQVTMLYIPAHFVDEIEVKRGDDLVFKAEGGISLSEDPNIRFFYKTIGPGDFSVTATDTEGQKFKSNWPVETKGF